MLTCIRYESACNIEYVRIQQILADVFLLSVKAKVLPVLDVHPFRSSQVKTADTGYMSRRLMKALEDLAVYYDNTVRNASASIIQFMYGDDGMDPSQMEEKKGRPLNFSRLFMKVKV